MWTVCVRSCAYISLKTHNLQFSRPIPVVQFCRNGKRCHWVQQYAHAGRERDFDKPKPLSCNFRVGWFWPFWDTVPRSCHGLNGAHLLPRPDAKATCHESAPQEMSLGDRNTGIKSKMWEMQHLVIFQFGTWGRTHKRSHSVIISGNLCQRRS